MVLYACTEVYVYAEIITPRHINSYIVLQKVQPLVVGKIIEVCDLHIIGTCCVKISGFPRTQDTERNKTLTYGYNDAKRPKRGLSFILQR